MATLVRKIPGHLMRGWESRHFLYKELVSIVWRSFIILWDLLTPLRVDTPMYYTVFKLQILFTTNSLESWNQVELSFLK